jgi:hypothetical protein
MRSIFGPVLDTSNFTETSHGMMENAAVEFKALYAALQKYMKEPWNRQSLHCHIIDDSELNAKVLAEAGHDHVGIFRGLIEQVYGTMWGLMSVPTFLPSIGDPSVEVAPPRRGGTGFPVMQFLTTDAQVTSQNAVLIPNDLQRLSFANILVDTALEFVLFHEMGHLVGGHFTLDSSFSCNRLGFANAPEPSKARLDQILELDADAFAGHTLSQVHHSNELAQIGHDLVKSTSWTPQELSMLALFTGVYVIFKMINTSGDERTAEAVTARPHPAVRSGIVVTSAMARSIHDEFIDINSFYRIYNGTIRNIEETWDEMGFPRLRSPPPFEWATDVVTELRTLFNALESERDTLDKVARLPRRWCDWGKGNFMHP